MFLLPSSSGSQDVKKLSCRAISQLGIEHILEIETSGDRIITLSYGSMTPQGQTCDFIADRTDKNSIWEDKGEKTIISMYALGQEAGKAIIEKGENSYRLAVVGDSRSACAPQGYIALTAIL